MSVSPAPRRNSVVFAIAAAVTAFAVVGFAPARVCAQDTPAAVPPATLAQALERVAWDADRGVLLVVDAANVKPDTGPETASTERFPDERTLPPPLPAPRTTDGTLPLREVAAHFGCKTVTFGNVSVLAPRTMAVLNGRPGPPDPLAVSGRERRLLSLLASLSPGQWRLLGSARGLGTGDLDIAQRRRFFAFLPQPFRLEKRIPFGRPRRVSRLSPEQRAGVRLRLCREMDVSLPRADDPKAYAEVVDYARSHNRQFERPELVDTIADDPLPGVWGVTLRADVPNRSKPGDLPFDAPALNALVNLSPSTDGNGEATAAPTLGELVRRAGQACRLELYADPRVGGLPVTVRGGERAVRAGDLLAALSLAVTGTFRKVAASGEAAYVLSDDREGIGTRRARLADWVSDASGDTWQNDRESRRRIARLHPTQHLQWAPGDPFTLFPETVKQIEARWTTPQNRSSNEEFHEVPFADLPPATQEALRTRASEWNAIGKTFPHPQSVRADATVRVALFFRLAYLVPGVGEVDDESGGRAYQFLPPVPTADEIVHEEGAAPSPSTFPLPATITTRVLLVAPRDADEARRAAREAKRRGLTQLWVRLPGDVSAKGDAAQQSEALLNAAVSAGKAQALPVAAVVRLLQKPRRSSAETEASPAALDRNILGETAGAHAARRLLAGTGTAALDAKGYRSAWEERGDWLRTDPPGSAAPLIRRVARLAATPGLTGFVLEDTAAPGYAVGENDDVRYEVAWDLGYTPEMRLAFLREAGFDPVDLVTSPDNLSRDRARLDLPFFPDRSLEARYVQTFEGVRPDPAYKTPLQRWAAFRYGANLRFLGDLFRQMRSARSTLPLWMASRSSDPFDRFGWYAPWERPDAPPRRLNFGVSEAQEARAQNGAGRPGPLLHAAYEGAQEPAYDDAEKRLDPARRFAVHLKTRLDTKNAWNGLVLDLSRVSLDDALSALDTLGLPRPAGRTPSPAANGAQ